MFGREPHLPIDVALGVTSRSGSYPAYTANLRDRLSLAYQKVIEESRKSATRNKQSYDSRARQATIQAGDLVLVRSLSIRGKHKLADRWEEDPYRVVECIPEFPVYKVQDKDEAHLLHQLPALNRSDPNSLCSLRAPRKIPVATWKPGIIEEDSDDELYTELVPISASKPLNPVAADFRAPHAEMPAAVENPEADGDGMKNSMQIDSQQVHPDPVVPGTDHQCDAGYPAVPNPGSPISDSDERPPEVTHSESGPDVAESDPVQGPPYMTRTGRTSKPPQRLICDPVWSQKASVLLYLANSQNQELLQSVFQNCSIAEFSFTESFDC